MIFSKNIIHKTLCILGIILFGGLFSACDMLGGIYDNDKDNPQTENTDDISPVNQDGSRTIYRDCSDFRQWTYIDLHTIEPTITVSTISPDDFSETGKPSEWDIAIHRYDVKTNGAGVLMTQYHSISELETAGLPINPQWVKDQYFEESIIIDLSRMLEGILKYAPGYKNTEASKWMNVDISNMPPDYAMYDNVILCQFTDGTYAAFQLKDFMSKDNNRLKGWMTVQYKYPIFKQ